MNQPDINDESTGYSIPQRLKTLLADRRFGNTTWMPLGLPPCSGSISVHLNQKMFWALAVPFEKQNDLWGGEVLLTFPPLFPEKSMTFLPPKAALDTLHILESTCGYRQVSAGVCPWEAVKSWSKSGQHS